MKSIKDEFYINNELLVLDRNIYETMYELLIEQNLIKQINDSLNYYNHNYLLTFKEESILKKSYFNFSKIILKLLLMN